MLAPQGWAVDAEAALADLRALLFWVQLDGQERHGVNLFAWVEGMGRSGDGALWAAGSRHSPPLRAALEEAVRDVPLPVRVGHHRLGWVPFLEHDWTEAGDHFAFHQPGIPWVYLGTTNDPETHDPGDTMGSIDEEFFVGATDTVLRIVAHLAERPPTGRSA